jgi:ABC-type cobalamin transport system ATPase subunit
LSNKRFLPSITRIELRDFSLYRNMRTIDVPVRSAGVFCLAGANGLGKSSFLAAINFALTGIVAAPNRSFRDFEQYYSDSLEYSRKYFDGRVAELDHATAEVRLTFVVAEKTYHIVRSLFEPESLRELSIRSGEDDAFTDVLRVDDATTGEDIHSVYAQALVRDCNVGSFPQFVFLQHFLLSFDERRHLLFWDVAVTEPALYLAFGLDADETVTATDLRSKIDKAESNARNAQWQATQARNRLQELGLEPNEVGKLGDLVEEHQTLTKRADDAVANVGEAQRALEDAKLLQAEASARQEQVRRQYDDAFASRLIGRHDPSLHPSVQTTLIAAACDMCGSAGPQIVDVISKSLESRRCPLCKSPLDTTNRDTDTEVLRQLDAELAIAAENHRGTVAKVARLDGEVRVAGAQLESASMLLAQFESTHQRRLPGLKSASGTLAAQGNQLVLEQQSAIRRRDEFRRQRDRYREQLRPLQEKLTTAFSDAELEFVPLFRTLAHKFIGLDLDIFLDPRASSGFALGLEVEGIRRRSTTQLSESQRFFLDIALRMALARHMASEVSPAALLVDTPEGSLDIAYEARAGDMFADFVEQGHQIVMTANINASQLLRRLAKRCGPERMELVRMTDWAPLSEVQASEEELFDEAFETIEENLETGGRDAAGGAKRRG